MEQYAESSVFVEAEFGVLLKHFRASRRLSVDEMGMMLGVSGNYIYMMERGKHPPSALVRDRFERLSASANIFAAAVPYPEIRERDIAVISWAQAGRATAFEEMPIDWDNVARSSCPDQQAFGIRLVGDSMESEYHAGEVVVVMPNCVAQSGSLVVVRLLDDGVMFKQFNSFKTRPNRFKLCSYNKAYAPIEMTWDQVHWVYPVFAARMRSKR